MQPATSVLEPLRADIDDALGRTLDVVLPRLAGHHAALGPVADELRGFLADGKRIRPALLLLGYEAGGGSDAAAVMGPALALELLHTCALIHDDVIDRAATRRGRATVHERFAAQHRAERLHGDADAYGQAIAILAGDVAFVHADECFLDVDVEVVAPGDLVRAFRRFTVLREEVMAGQVLDVHTAASRTTDRELALTIATLKSGRYSVARPLQIGALLAGADEALVEGLGRVGDPLGRAFQVRDDLLGVFGDQAMTGKSVASDLVEGKRTLLVAEAAARLDADAWTALDARLGDPALTDADAAELRATLERCGARDATERYVDEALAASDAHLGELGLPDTTQARLRTAAAELARRRT